MAPLTRIFEGYNYQVLKTKFLRKFFDGYKDLKVPEDVQPLSLFLASSFNVEVVYVILKGITQFAYVDLAQTDQYRRDSKQQDEINESSRASAKYVKTKKVALQIKETSKTDFMLEFNTIKIKNHDTWATSTGRDQVNDDMTERNVAGAANR